MSTTTSSTSSTGSSIALSGLASGIDWQSIVSQLVQVARAPEQQLQTQQSQINAQNTALGNIKTELGNLQTDVTTLLDPTFFDSRTASSSDTSLATATADTGATMGTYNFSVSQLATAATLQGTTGAGGPLSSTNNVSSLVLDTAGFATPVTAGTFTVDGQQITVDPTQTLQSVFDQISTATGGNVTASYSATTDKITLTSADSSEIVLGSATDTSNFLQATKLYNNGTSTVTSSGTLGAVNQTNALNQANLTTAISDGGSGAGAFTINGVTINFSASADSVTDVVNRINDSAAGVFASYDPNSNSFSLTNKTTGDVGISMQDVTGNFLAATGLSGGTLEHGKNLLYTLNSGSQLTSQSNTITSDSSGISGLSVDVTGTGSFSVGVAADTATIKSAITGFVNEYNKVQTLIDTQTASTTDSSGKVTAGILQGDSEVYSINSTLRSLMTSTVSGLSGTLNRLDSLGFDSNGNNDTLSTTDLSGLDSALSSNLSGLKDLFTNSSTGLAVQMNTFLNNTIGDNGTLTSEQSGLTSESSDITTQIANKEQFIQQYQQQLTNEFVAMETAMSQSNQQISYLQKNFP